MFSALIAFLISLSTGILFYPFYINFMKKLNFGQSISEYSLQEDQQKEGTPTMGGVLFVLISIVVTLVVFPRFYEDQHLIMVLLAFAGYAVIGFIDDFLIVVQHNNRGLPALLKLLLQIALAVGFFVIYRSQLLPIVHIPFTDIVLGNYILYQLLVFFMFVGASNAVNITDGMDGLAGGTCFIALLPFFILSLQKGETGIAVFIAALCGALLGFLRYNIKPARIFMGDAGALALGGVLAAIGIVLKEEFALVFIGGIFVYETVCVILQIGSVKLFKKRIFRYTPIHYSFRLRGCSEQNIVRYFWLAGIVCAVLGYVVALS